MYVRIGAVILAAEQPFPAGRDDLPDIELVGRERTV
jgi:hypothetical protein